MLKIIEEAKTITNMGPTKVYVGEEVGTEIRVLFTLEPGESKAVTEQRIVAESIDGTGVVHIFESR